MLMVMMWLEIRGVEQTRVALKSPLATIEQHPPFHERNHQERKKEKQKSRTTTSTRTQDRKEVETSCRQAEKNKEKTRKKSCPRDYSYWYRLDSGRRDGATCNLSSLCQQNGWPRARQRGYGGLIQQQPPAPPCTHAAESSWVDSAVSGHWVFAAATYEHEVL